LLFGDNIKEKEATRNSSICAAKQKNSSYTVIVDYISRYFKLVNTCFLGGHIEIFP
jgi:hypothetical protein